jgi:hypothetical protein
LHLLLESALVSQLLKVTLKRSFCLVLNIEYIELVHKNKYVIM